MRFFWVSLRITLCMCGLLALGYVLILRLFAYVAGPAEGRFETVSIKGKVVGAALVGQSFNKPAYFWTRPSAVNYNGAGSGGSNKAITNKVYLAEVEQRMSHFLKAHPYLSREQVPSEMVCASGSGLDPDISPQAAQVQIIRVSEQRGWPQERIRHWVDSLTEPALGGMMGTRKVNVLKLNVVLDQQEAL